MPNREPSDEWKKSSDWDSIVGWDGGYILGVGYCYTEQFAPFFLKQNKQYHYFQTKWGRCGTTFLFSALKPDSLIIPVAWGNAATICGSANILFRIWKELLNNLLQLNVPTMIIDFPAAWNKSRLFQNLGSKEGTRIIQHKRVNYYNEIIIPILKIHNRTNISYLDLYHHIPYHSKLITENINLLPNEHIDSPWHINPLLIELISKHFIKLTNHKYNQMAMITEIAELHKTLS